MTRIAPIDSFDLRTVGGRFVEKLEVNLGYVYIVGPFTFTILRQSCSSKDGLQLARRACAGRRAPS